MFQSKSSARPTLVSQLSAPDTCFFCQERVYVVERHTAEGLYFHRGCFRCHYCNSSLRLGAYAFQRNGDDQRESGRRFKPAVLKLDIGRFTPTVS